MSAAGGIEFDALCTQLARGLTSIPGACAGATPEESRFRPASGAWSMVEIVNHLVDEEVEDFRARLRSTLVDPSAPWRPNDPPGWARDRRYQERDLGESLARFDAERRGSLAWLAALPRSTDWSCAHVHPKFGPIRAGDLLVSWAAHDALHLRQIAKRWFEIAGARGGMFGTAYAGEWGA